MVKLSFTLFRGKFLRRLNRFMVEAELDGKRVLAHLPNSGRLLTVLSPKCEAYLKQAENPARKSKYTLFAVKKEEIPIIVDTRFANKLVKLLTEKSLLPPLRKYRILKENALKGKSKIDFLLGRDGQRFYLEVKSVSYVINGVAMFPDAPTSRGRRHVETLMRCLEEGFYAGVLFNVQRSDAKILRPCHEVDPKFSGLLRKAVEGGLKVFTQTLVFHPTDRVEVVFDRPVFTLS